MIFQDPMTSLNPVLTIGRQVARRSDPLDMNKKEAEARAGELLDQVGIESAKMRLKDYPHQFSGRDAPTGHDRGGPRLRAEAADRRRADDSARRHDPGADPGPAPRAGRRAGHGPDPDHARPRRRRRHVRARERDVRGDVRRDRHCAAGVRQAAAPVHARPAPERPPPRRRAEDGAPPDRGRSRDAALPAAGVPVARAAGSRSSCPAECLRSSRSSPATRSRASTRSAKKSRSRLVRRCRGEARTGRSSSSTT